MQGTRILPAALSIILMMSLAGCGPSHAPSTSNVRYALLGDDDQPLREDFNHDRGKIRLLFLVDPICPGCLNGLAEMGDDLLSKLSVSAPVRVYVVFEPVIGGQAKNIAAAAALLRSSAPRLYWNPTGDFGWQMSHMLGYWNGHRWVYGWDTWLIYRPDAVWSGAAAPKPAFLMDQLSGLPHESRFPWLAGRVFAARVQAMVDDLNRRAVSQ
jgi:hypothetical protein